MPIPITQKSLFQCNDVERIIFHYNKKHNEDRSVPQWVVKHKGESYYVNHLVSEVGFHTKETPGNEHTKGSLQFKVIENEDGTREAIIFNKS